MLTISTIPEALGELGKLTGRTWTDSELFDVATANAISLHAAPPITAETTIQDFVIGEGLREKFRMGQGHAVLAVLFPWQVGQLWISGETKTRHPSDHDRMEGRYHWFTEPVRVTREQVRIKAETLRKILTIWRDAQKGAGRRFIRPEWMTPPDAGHDTTETERQTSVASSWEVRTPKKYTAYIRPLYVLLADARKAGGNRPTARDVLDAWKAPKTPSEVKEVTAKHLTYTTENGVKKTADLEAIGKAIARMTTA